MSWSGEFVKVNSDKVLRSWPRVDGQRRQILHIVRSDNGKSFNLTKAEFPIADQLTGRFAQILPPKVPDKEMQTLARTMLQVEGVRPIRFRNPGRFRK